MVYSLLNASAIGFDVVRRPAASQLAEVLLAALTAPPLLLWELAAAHPAAALPRQEQREALAAAALVRFVHASPHPAHSPRSDDTGGPGSLAGLVARLSAFTLGGPAELDRLVAEELLGPGSATTAVPPHVRRLAADAFAEAALEAWTASPTDPPGTACDRLRTAVSTCRLPAAVDVGPCGDQLSALLAALPRTPAQWTSWQGVDRLDPLPPVSWAQAMHEASWAAHLSGRTRAVAAAQLLAAAHLGSSGATSAGSWLWNPVSALVSTTVMGDLLPTGAAAGLTDHTLPPR